MIGILQNALLPSGLATVLCLAGLAAAVVRPTRPLAIPMLATAGGILLLFSSGGMATLLIVPLESAYPVLNDPREHPDARTIVLLTAYAVDDQSLPLSARLNVSSALRILEVANIRSRRSDCRVIVSGSADTARIMGDQLRLLGVPEDLLSVDANSSSTSASAEWLKPMIGQGPVFLVTSAGHMKRAVGVFRKNGMEPIPVPTDFQLPGATWRSYWTLSPMHLRASDLAVHEYVGLVWYRLTNRV